MRKNIRMAILLLIAGYLLLILTDVKEYVLWQQVIDYHDWVNAPDSPESDYSHFLHMPRYFLTYPVFYLSGKIPFADLNAVFGFEIFILVIASWLLLCSEHLLSRRSFGVLLALVGISLLMNGRLVFAFFSASGLIFLDRRLTNAKAVRARDFLLLALSTLASTVSSGAILTFGVLSVFFFYRHAHLFVKGMSLIVAGLLLVAVSLLLLIAAAKGYVYYGEGVDALHGMLTHGLGGHLPWISLGAVAAAAALYPALKFLKSSSGLLYAMCIIGMSCLLISWGGIAYVIPAVLALIDDSCTKSGGREISRGKATDQDILLKSS